MSHSYLVELATSAGLSGSLSWLCEYIATEKVPIQGDVPETELTKKNLGWGEVKRVGVGSRTFNVPFMRPNVDMDFDEFWGMPEEVKVDLVAREERIRTSTTITNHPTVSYISRAPVPKKNPSVSEKKKKYKIKRK